MTSDEKQIGRGPSGPIQYRVFVASSKQDVIQSIAGIICKAKKTTILCICNMDTVRLWEDEKMRMELRKFFLASLENKLKIVFSSKIFIDQDATIDFLKESLPRLGKMQKNLTGQLEIYWLPGGPETNFIICDGILISGPWKNGPKFSCSIVSNNEKNKEYTETFEKIIKASSILLIASPQ